VQLSTGTPKEARELGAWAAGRGVEYLDGAILAWPSQIGGSDTVILVSGPEATRRGAEPLLKCLAGALTPMGEELGSSSALFAAVLAYLGGDGSGCATGRWCARPKD
jgi:3-hydroxyisobutyrate dehydrogenase-like beta-hydroxyacid dehydrogenase